MPTDESLMLAVAGGELQQLAELYQRYRRPLFGFLRNRGNDAATAEDLLQATFERALRYRTSFRAEATFKSWIFTIARNLHADHYRRGTRQPTTEVTERALHLSVPAADLAWEDRETADQLRAAVAALPPAYREVVELAWRRGLKYAEIARVLNLSEANVKVRVHRATKRLRLHYAKLNRL